MLQRQFTLILISGVIVVPAIEAAEMALGGVRVDESDIRRAMTALFPAI